MSRLFNLRNLAMMAVLSALGFVLMIFPHFPILPIAPWLDVDFSDVPVIFGAFYIHPIAGIIIALIKNLLHLTVTTTAGIGELSNFVLSVTFCLPIMFVRSRNPKKWKVILATVIGVVITGLMACVTNYFIMMPLYKMVLLKDLAITIEFLLVAIIPFNLIKFSMEGAVFVLLFMIAHKPVSRLLRSINPPDTEVHRDL